MSPVEGGRLCASCDRRVVDFRAATDAEIVRAHGESDERVCGAYSPEQVARWSGPILVSLTIGASLLGGASVARAASPPSAVHAELSASHRDADTLVVRGVVSDSAGAPIAGAIVRLDQTPISAVADSAGRYEIRVPGAPNGRARKVRLRFGKIGYWERVAKVRIAPDAPATLDAVLAEATIHLDGIVFPGGNP
jgi:hypothetical protein